MSCPTAPDAAADDLAANLSAVDEDLAGEDACGREGTTNDPFEVTLWGEYARIFLVGTAGISAVFWATRLSLDVASLAMVTCNLLVMGIAVGHRFAGLPRCILSAMLAAWVVVTFLAKQDPAVWWLPAFMFSPVATIGAFLVLMYRDCVIAIGNRSQVTWRIKGVAACLLVILVYMILIPGIDAFMSTGQDQPTSYRIDELSFAEMLRIRSSKLAVFAIFAYAGACVGSFLNVVAASAPRGESIALRSSACPKCGVPIRRVDNLPLVSYLWLGGRCRDCGVDIPVRYFVVEVLGLTIFAALFLYELVTGAANVPGFRHYHHAGILWIILYTKWPVVGIYFFHCLLLSSVLMLALTEQDRLRLPRWLVTAMLLTVAITVVAAPSMLTVSVADQTPFHLPDSFPAWLDRAANGLAGALLGWGIARFAGAVRITRPRTSSSLTLALILLGLSFGWQALLTIAAGWLLVMWGLRLTQGRHSYPRWLTATTLLFGVTMLHHPIWKWAANTLSF